MGYMLSRNEVGIVRSGEIRSDPKQSPRSILPKRGSNKFRKIHKKAPVPESLFLLKLPQPQTCNFIKKETLAQVFSCEFYEICKSTFFYRTLSMAASIIYHKFRRN